MTLEGVLISVGAGLVTGLLVVLAVWWYCEKYNP